MDAEITAMAKRITAGVNVNKETIAADLIKEIGPQGDSYLTTDHTLNWLRKGEYVKTQLAVTGSKATWDNQGSKDTYQLARDLVKTYPEKPEKELSTECKRINKEIIEKFSK